MFKITTNEKNWKEGASFDLDELARQGAKRMIAVALELEVAEYIERNHHLKDELGHALVVRNGRARGRRLLLGCGTVEITAPRAHDRREGSKFTSSILPPYMRRSPKISEVLPILYLKGLSSGDFSEALEALVGGDAQGLSAATIIRLKSKWYEEYLTFRRRDLSGKRYAYIWADGVNISVRLGDDPRLCLLVVIGAREDGTKELLAVEDGYRESTESWANVLRQLKHQGMEAPVLAIGDGNLGLWAAARSVWPEIKEQRCWVHKIANVLDKLPKRLQARAKQALHEIMHAPTRDLCLLEMDKFEADYQAKYPKAAECLTKDTKTLTTFFDFPAEHWIHIRTTNPIESPFATVKGRTRATKGAGSREAALTMAYKLLVSAEKRWRKLTAAHLVAKVIEGMIFKDGVEQIEKRERVVA